MTRLIPAAVLLAFGIASPALAATAPSDGVATAASGSVATPVAMPANYSQLAALFREWRAFASPPMTADVADYGVAAMAGQAAALPGWRQRLAAIDRTGWPKAALIDHQLVAAEMNGLDFHHRVLKPWARDPTFYANVFADTSDVPLHEGPYAEPHIDLYKFDFPLDAADEKRLAALLAGVPAHLAAARINLKGSNARDLWTYGNRAFLDQSETLAKLGDGTLVMNTLQGRKPATIKGAGSELRRAIAAAKAATDDFAAFVAREAPKKTGPSGVGKENYNWFVKNVELMPYDWDAQVTLLRRELDRSVAAMRLEEVRNRDVPQVTPLADPAAFDKWAKAKAVYFSQFLADTGIIPDAPWSRTAIAAQTIDYVPPADRNFFAHVNAHDPLPLISHFTHWIDLARMKEIPHASPIRREPSRYGIYAGRSEGFATAFEEVAMHAGLYDDIPHGRELVWVMLANRAARGLASLYVQSNAMDLAEAGKFHAEWTPRGWSDPASPLVGFEQLLYARQPGYGPSYVLGKLQLDRLLADLSHADEVAGRPFVMRSAMQRVMDAGVIPVALINAELVPAPTP